MEKLVVLKLDDNLTKGVRATLEIGPEGERATVEIQGFLPPKLEIADNYDRWQSVYRSLGDFRIKPIAITISESRTAQLSKCRELAEQLSLQINSWLDSEPFRKLKDTLLVQLNPSDTVRFLIKTDDIVLRRLPWYCWNIFNGYPKAEIALSATAYKKPPLANINGSRNCVKILAILGNSENINIEQDCKLLEGLPSAEVTFLVEPNRRKICQELWENNWDILFFAGHSDSDASGRSGKFYINKTESLTVEELKQGFKLAVNRGLQLAILNSCDGLGIARQFEDLGIPQTIVMREPVCDRVAQDFLKYFLASFCSGESLYVSVRLARQRLAECESEIPAADWLPVICQNPAANPPTWQELANKPAPFPWRRRLQIGLLAIAISAVSVTGMRSLGWLQIWELQAFDQLMRLRPAESSDSRLLLVEATETDIEKYGFPLPDGTIAQAVANLAQYRPQTIALDIFRPRPSGVGYAALAASFQSDRSLIGLCSVKESGKPNKCGIKPPPALPKERLGFSDVVADADGILRRHLLFMQPQTTDLCATEHSLSMRAALHYLAAKGITPETLSGDKIGLGKAVFAPIHGSTGAYQNLDNRGFQIMLNYRSPRTFIQRVSLTELLEGKVSPNLIKDRIIFIGVTAPISNPDDFFTPYSAREIPYQKMPGVLLQAQMSSQIISAALDGRPLLQIVPVWQEMLWILGGAAVGSAIAIVSRRRLFAVLRAIAFAGILVGICWFLLIQGWWVPLVPSVVAMLGACGIAIVCKRI
ncbi:MULTISPECIES: CHASE2 domain-containing protein [unclassified Microcoleus]|uniref:CHASE2 domain-containing protein n=1 Tax=unclassified Microcoleus TaxID=2642155 RepID=UPI001D6391DD|nr:MULTISPECIES: CHASE2 domain-containing protein [unclassified Microcoleus]MCC3588761.1 CHASE2 domain-containing protein [Microcoleus sp. PH2017_30_WIL_O_A]MCC3595919.1 CHASE2 domain-containing protein [Microcoleus sp. PH2017_26_ELK_O_A]MCC3620721.1 CHASE2 domain-containing protein [Microcoleus sp. PH2017_36_ELK_O_B]